MHNNGTLLRIQMNGGGTAGDLGYQDAGGTPGQCTTNCHSGQTLSMDTNSGWTVALGAFGGVACGECHTGGVQPAVASGAHTAHNAGTVQLVDGGAACSDCHGNNGGLLYHNATAGTHGNGSVTWTGAPFYSTATRNDLTGTCSGAAACHVSSGTNIQWGQTQVATNDCKVCHQGAADTDNFAWEDTATGISRINITEYSAAGHGSANGIGTTDCMGCHDIAQAHVNSSDLSGGTGNPFRLRNLGGTGPNGFTCSYNNAACHLGATPTNEGALGLTYGGIVNHDQTAMGAQSQVSTWGFAPKCVDCHDPHGDSVSAVNNAKFISNDIWDKGSGANWVPTAYSTIGNTALTFSVVHDGPEQPRDSLRRQRHPMVGPLPGVPRAQRRRRGRPEHDLVPGQHAAWLPGDRHSRLHQPPGLAWRLQQLPSARQRLQALGVQRLPRQHGERAILARRRRRRVRRMRTTARAPTTTTSRPSAAGSSARRSPSCSPTSPPMRSRSRSAGIVTRTPAARTTTPTAATRGSTSWAAGAFGRFTVGAEPVPPTSPTADTGSAGLHPRHRGPGHLQQPGLPQPGRDALLERRAGLDRRHHPEVQQHDLSRRGDLRRFLRRPRQARQLERGERQGLRLHRVPREQLQRRRIFPRACSTRAARST